MKDFGLKAFSMKQTIPSKLSDLLGYPAPRRGPRKESLAFLTLPCRLSTHDISEQDSQQDEYDFHIDSSIGIFGTIDPASLVLTEQHRAQFRKAMRYFGLGPKLCPIQVMGDHDEKGPILSRVEKVKGPATSDINRIRERLDAKVSGESRGRELDAS